MEAAFYIFITPQHTQLSLHSYHLAIYAKSNAHSGGRPIRVTQTHTCPVVPPSSLLRKARCYTRYTQQVRLQSWRNPKDGILSTEVVFSVFTFFFFFFMFIFSLRWAWAEGRVPFCLLGWDQTKPPPGWGPVCEGTSRSDPWDPLRSRFGEDAEFSGRNTGVFFRGGL